MNVLFIITDQQRADHLGCYGNEMLQTPNIDNIADDGVRFTNAYCANPMCMPNRASLLTGLYPNAHGVRSNGINLPTNIPTITDTLRERGWYTKAIGKMHYQFNFPPYKRSSESAELISEWIRPKTLPEKKQRFEYPYYGFEDVEITLGHGDLVAGDYLEWLEERAPKQALEINKRFSKFFENLMYDTPLSTDLYPTTYVKERTIDFLEKYKKGKFGEKPFFLHCSFPDPHHPVCPPGKYFNMFDPDDISLPPNFHDKENLYEHHFLGRYLKDPVFRGALLRESTKEEVKKFLSLTYGSISLIDHSIGEILASLNRLGLEDDTMVIYTSDHGDLAGDHGLLLKGPSPYKGILNVPLIWKVPNLTEKGETDSLISSIDIPKTILHLLNIKERRHPLDMQGYDFSEVLMDPTRSIRDCCYIEEDEEVTDIQIRLRHLITDKYKLTVYEGFNKGDLYNLERDPQELNNLWDKERELRKELVRRLLQENLKAQSHYPKRQSLT